MQQGAPAETTELAGYDPMGDILSGFSGEQGDAAGDDAEPGLTADDFDEGDDENLEEPEEEGEPAPEAEGKSEPAADALPLDDPKALGVMLTRDPNFWRRIPTKHRAEAIEEALGHAVAYGRGLGQQDMQGRVQESAQVASLVAEKDALAANDPDGFADWAEANPADAARYYGVKAQGRAAADPAQQEQQAILTQARDITAPLREFPEVVEEFRKRFTAGEYPSSQQGLLKLSRDVGEELAKARAAKAAADVAASERSKAAVRRRGIARPLAVGAGGAGGRAAISLAGLDPVALAMEGFTEERAKANR